MSREIPPMFEDRYGLTLSTSSEAAAAAYREGIDLMLSAWPGAEEALDAAIAADPEFALAQAARGRMHYIYADGRAAKVRTAAARELVARNGTAREESHVEVLALSMEGQPAKSLERAARAFAGGDYAVCVRILEPAAVGVVRIGGSHAQREVIEDTLLVALMKSGQTVRTQTLLDRRLHRRPSPRDVRWRASIVA